MESRTACAAEERILAELRGCLREIADRAKREAGEALARDDFELARAAILDAEAAQAVFGRFAAAFGDGATIIAAQPEPAPPPPPSREPPSAPIPGDPPTEVPPVVEPPAPRVSEPAPVIEPPAPAAKNGAAGVLVATQKSGAKEVLPAATKPPSTPKPKPDPKPAYDRGELARRLSAATRIELKPPAGLAERLDRRGFVLAARGFLAGARPEEREHYRSEVEILRDSNDEPFYGYNNAREWPPATWFEMAEAYLATAAYERLRGAGLETFVGSARDESAAAAAAALVFAEGVFRTGEQPASDGDLRSLLDRIATDHKNLVAMYRPTAADPAKRSQLITMARRIYEWDERVRRDDARGKEIAAARQELQTAFESGGDLEAKLPGLVQRLLDLGIPATDGGLNAILVGYETVLENAPGPKMARLRESLAKYGRGRKVQVAEASLVSDEEYDRKREEVLAISRGKVLGLVGGNKGQRERRAEIIAALELKELLWPDVEETTHLRSIYPQVQRAEILGLIVRFSRHSYQEVIKDAQKEGRQTFHVTAGLNPRAIVNNLHAQLLRG